MTAGIYLRKSRADENDPDALHRHRETLLAFAKKNEINIIEIYEEIVSGESLYMRPQMLRLLDDVGQQKFDAVLCMDIDRLGRGDMASQGVILDAFRTSGCKIVTPRRVYDLNNEIDETYSEFEAFMARQEYKMITRRMRRGVIAAAKEGSHVSEVPFGYQRAWEGKRATLAIDQDEAKWVKTAFDLYVNQGEGCQHIADLFNRSGVPAKKSEEWGRTAIRRILQNRIYTGTWVYNKYKWQHRKKMTDKNVAVLRPQEDWIVVEDAFPAIVSKELFDQAQEIFHGRHHSPYFTGEFKNPLAGLVYCGTCGKRMQRQHQQSKGKNPFLRCPTPGCSKAMRLDMVEQAVLLALRDEFAKSQNLGPTAPPGQPMNQEIRQALQKELRTIQTQRNSLYDLLEQGVYTIDIFTQRSTDLANREKAAQAQLKKLDQEESKEVNTEELRRRIRNILDLYDKSDDINQKNALLKSVIDRVDYFRPKDAPHRQFSIRLTMREF